MPETPQAAQKDAKGAGTRVDVTTLGGIALALAGIIGGLLLEKGSIQDVIQFTAGMIVLGGTFGAMLVTTPLPVVLRALRGLKFVFFEQASSASATIELL